MGGADGVFFQGFIATKSAKRGLQISDGAGFVSAAGVNLQGPGTGSEHGVDAGYVTGPSKFRLAEDAYISGYSNSAIRAWGQNYPTVTAYFRGAPRMPAGTASMKQLTAEERYYLSSGDFTAMGIDRPAGATGAYLLINSPNSGDGLLVAQTLIRASTGAGPTVYRRSLNASDNSASSWFMTTASDVGYSS